MATSDEVMGVAAPRSADSVRQRRRWLLMVVVPAVALAIAAYLYLVGGRYESTDDATVKAARVAISANVPGRVQELYVHDNQSVHKGDLLFRLELEPFQIEVESATAQVAAARLQVESMKANYRQRESELASARETLAYQQSEYGRQQRLLAREIASQVQVDRNQHAVHEAASQVAGVQQQMNAIRASLGGDPNIDPNDHPDVKRAQAVLDRARLNLGYATVTAPSDGIVTRVEQLQVGTYIAASAPVFALVSTGDVWVEANFKESQLAKMRVGQSAKVTIDSLPGKTFEATVASMSPGTGSEFSELPPENATGNWVKVVQRVPVRIAFSKRAQAADAGLQLQDGLSANVSVDTQFHRNLFGPDETTPAVASDVK